MLTILKESTFGTYPASSTKLQMRRDSLIKLLVCYIRPIAIYAKFEHPLHLKI